MKSLLEIQQDVRALSRQIGELSHAVAAIESDIDDMRDTKATDIDYRAIARLADKLPLKDHPLGRLDGDRTCRLYLKLLFGVVNLDAGVGEAVNRLVFLQWLLSQTGLEWELADLHRDSMQTSPDDYQEFAETLPQEYRDFFIVDALVTAGISGSPNREILEYVADLCAIFAVGQKNLRSLSLTAQAVLCQDVDIMSKADLRKCYDTLLTFDHYLDASVRERAFLGLHDLVVAFPADDADNLIWKVGNRQAVCEGDVIATHIIGKKGGLGQKLTPIYASRLGHDFEEESITATSSGTLTHFRYCNVYYGVISDETVSVNSIKEWVQAVRRNETNGRA